MSTHEISLTVNGTAEELTVEARTLLVHALRDQLGYTGPKVGCERGKCGACTVHLDGEPIKSCTTLAVQADGCEVTTVAGIGDEDGALHPVQSALHEAHGLQCGYCTPGMVMTIVDLLDREERVSRESVRRALKGNVCRCTGYQNIVDGALSAAASMDGVTVDRGDGAAAVTAAECADGDIADRSTGGD